MYISTHIGSRASQNIDSFLGVTLARFQTLSHRSKPANLNPCKCLKIHGLRLD